MGKRPDTDIEVEAARIFIDWIWIAACLNMSVMHEIAQGHSPFLHSVGVDG